MYAINIYVHITCAAIAVPASVAVFMGCSFCFFTVIVVCLRCFKADTQSSTVRVFFDLRKVLDLIPVCTYVCAFSETYKHRYDVRRKKRTVFSQSRPKSFCIYYITATVTSACSMSDGFGLCGRWKRCPGHRCIVDAYVCLCNILREQQYSSITTQRLDGRSSRRIADLRRIHDAPDTSTTAITVATTVAVRGISWLLACVYNAARALVLVFLGVIWCGKRWSAALWWHVSKLR